MSTEKVNATLSFFVPFGFWAYAHLADLALMAQILLFCVGIIGGLPAMWKGMQFVRNSLRRKK